MRYMLQVFDHADRRYGTHHCDGAYDTVAALSNAVIHAVTDATVGAIKVIVLQHD